jgi:hypothetical protein
MRRMPHSGVDVQNDERHEQIGQDNMRRVEYRVDPRIIRPPRGQEDPIEQHYAVLAEMGCDVAGQRHSGHACIQRQVTPLRGATLLARHERRQRRRMIGETPQNPGDDQQRRQSCRLVKIDIDTPHRGAGPHSNRVAILWCWYSAIEMAR